MREYMKLVEGWYDDDEDDFEDDDGPEWEPNTQTLPAGTIVYHGTSSDFEPDELESPAWVSTSQEVAQRFVTWNPGEGQKRVIVYQTTQDLELCKIEHRDDFSRLARKYGVDMEGSSRDMAEEFGRLPFDGWIIPDNYENGDDIMLSDTSRLEFVKLVDAQ